MDVAATIKAAKKVFKLSKEAQEYFDLVLDSRIIIKHNFAAGKFLRECPDFICDDFAIIDGVLRIYATGKRSPICDGASLAPDKVLGFDVVASSVVHDCIYHYLEEIAECWGWSVSDVRRLADEAFGCDMLYRARLEKNPAKRFAYSAVAYIYYYAVRLFGGIYHKTKAGLLVISAMLFLSGCAIPETFAPTGARLDYVITNIAARVESVEKPMPAPEKPQPSADAIDYSLLDWRYGGFNGSSAKHNPSVIICDLRINSGGMSYAWQSGGCENLGAKDRSDAACIAALFCLVDGVWIGGKFEWVSTSRLTRSWHNIDGYNGWSRSVFDSAEKYAFVIVSKDGRSRSNVILSE